MITVEDNHFAYLAVQKGRLSALAQQRQEWERAYIESLQGDLKSIKPHLPQYCGSILDVGSGLGGIDILLNRHYGGDILVTLLDGEDDRPVARRHCETFNDMMVAKDFLAKNGVHNVRTITPWKLGMPQFVDLVVSLGSWCFHYPPDVYLNYVWRCCHMATVVIVDVRSGRADYLQQLGERFEFISVVAHLRKATRWILRRKA